MNLNLQLNLTLTHQCNRPFEPIYLGFFKWEIVFYNSIGTLKWIKGISVVVSEKVFETFVFKSSNLSRLVGCRRNVRWTMMMMMIFFPKRNVNKMFIEKGTNNRANFQYNRFSFYLYTVNPINFVSTMFVQMVQCNTCVVTISSSSSSKKINDTVLFDARFECDINVCFVEVYLI